MPSSTAAIQAGDDNDNHHSPADVNPSAEDYDYEEDPEEEVEEVEEEEEEEEEPEEEEEEPEEEEEEPEEEPEEEEEEEVEEEEEEEEEVEEEEGDVEDGIDEEEAGEDPSRSLIATDNIQQDVIQSVEFERNEKSLRSCFTQEKAEVGLPSDAFDVVERTGNFKSSGPSNEQLEALNGELCMPDKVSKLPKLEKHLINFEDNGIQESSVSEKDAESFPRKKSPRSHEVPLTSEIRDDETNKPSSVAGEVATEINKESNVVFHSEGGGIEQSGLQSEDIKQRASSLAAPQIRPRSLSPCTEFVDGTKQSALICDFFSKGWCIKGNSCKFLHTKDHVDNAGQQPERNVAAAKQKSEVQIDEGLTDSTEKSRLSGLHDPLASSSKNAGRESMRQDPCPNNYSNSPIVESSFNASGNSLFEKNGSFPSRSVISSGPNQSRWTPSSYAATMDEVGSKRSRSSFDDHTSPALSRYPSSGTKYSLPTIANFSSDRVSAWMRSSMPYGSSYLNADSLDAQKVLNRDGEFHAFRSASLLRSSSPFSGSEAHITHPSFAGQKRKNYSYDWEPSKPFRPSFFISLPGMSSPGSQYDPLRDSIEHSNPVDGSFIIYSLGDPNLNGVLHPEYNADKYPIASHDKFQDNVLDKDWYVHEKNLSISEAEAAGSSVHDQQNEKGVPKGEKPLSPPTHGRDVSETNKIKTGFDPRHQSDGSRHRKELKVDRGRHTDEMDVDQKTDAVLNQDSKASRHFRAALVESVKEFLKPAWREGRLSKDAHNLIVKKAVEKVLRTVQSHQIPSTVESIQQYLSLSQPKMAKLVEGYADKYGKS